MTAVVGILNKQSVALAADSAVTIDGPGNRKIFNRANKLFALSKYHPVGIMLYNSATLMGTPWETIIKMYRRQLADRRFATVRHYQEDFFQFLRNRHWFTDASTALSFIKSFFSDIISSLISEAAKNNPDTFQQTLPSNEQKIIAAILEEVKQLNNKLDGTTEICTELEDYSLDTFIEEYKVAFSEILKTRLGDLLFLLLQPADVGLVMKAAWQILRMKEQMSVYTGLIFAGFGEDEIFPSLVAFNISFSLGKRLRYYEDSNRSVVISHNNPGAVADFAQTDVIRTILTGIDPWLDSVHQNNFKQLLSKFRDDLVGSFGKSDANLKQALEQIDLSSVAQSYYDMNAELQNEKYILPMLTAVNTLSKEDLAEMAESLIYLTYLKRRITFAEESVGGPVDVAIISKGDGLVWIKRKHYFAPALNPHFFDNYFKT